MLQKRYQGALSEKSNPASCCLATEWPWKPGSWLHSELWQGCCSTTYHLPVACVLPCHETCAVEQANDPSGGDELMFFFFWVILSEHLWLHARWLICVLCAALSLHDVSAYQMCLCLLWYSFSWERESVCVCVWACAHGCLLSVFKCVLILKTFERKQICQ